MKQADLPLFEQEGATCCYAKADKFWVKDRDGIPWEMYTLLEDAEAETAADNQLRAFLGQQAENAPSDAPTQSAEPACCVPTETAKPACCAPAALTEAGTRDSSTRRWTAAHRQGHSRRLCRLAHVGEGSGPALA